MYRKFHIITIAILCSFFMSSYIFAQPHDGSRGPMPPDSTHIARMVDDLTKAVSLSKEQQEKVTKLFFQHFEQLKQLHEKRETDRDVMRKSHDELRKNLDKDIKALLDEKQKEKYETFIKEREERRHRDENRPPR